MIKLKIIIIFIFFAFISSSLGREGFGSGDQEWGYVTVRPKAHMFWWLYYTTADVDSKYENKPLIIWLQGGPGVSGTGYGNFEELGPLDSNLKPRNYTWIKDYNVVFIDNPVGTGFSYVEPGGTFSKNNEQIAKDLMQCIQEFFTKIPKLRKSPTYILAESYGGKMTVEFANLWYQEQIKGNIKSNFKGIGLIDSLISADDMYKSVAPYLLNLGMIDSIGYEAIDKTANDFIKASSAGDWYEAVSISNQIEYLMQKLTYGVDRLNVLTKMKPNRLPVKTSLRQSLYLYSGELIEVMGKVKHTLDLESDWGDQENDVYYALIEDSRKPVVHHVEKLLNETNIKVFVLNGQLDVIINSLGTLRWVEKLKWNHAEEWFSAPRNPLVVNNIIEGYSKGYGNLKLYWVNRSGHMVPAGNPAAMEEILKDLINN